LDSLGTLVSDEVDILAIAESKLDDSFPISSFQLHNFKSPYRLDITDQSGGILVFVRSNIPSRQLTNYKYPKDIQIIPMEINLRKRVWLILNIYRNPTQNIAYFLENVYESILFYSKYENIIIMGDFNLEPDNPELAYFMESNSLYNHMKSKTCWKSSAGTCIDLILSNRKYSLMHTSTVETGLSDYHSLIYTMLKSKFDKSPSTVINYRDWKNFNDINFQHDLEYNLPPIIANYKNFNDIFCSVLEKHAPQKTKFLRANNKPHVSKALRKAIMKRSKLKNIANKSGKLEDMVRYRKQRNLVVSLNRQAKRDFLSKAGHTPSQGFWKTFKPLFSNKSSNCREKPLLVDNGVIYDQDEDICDIFLNYFNSITDSLNIPEIPAISLNIESDPISSIIAKYADHPSIIAIRLNYSENPSFDLKPVTEHMVLREIQSLNSNKTVSGPIPIRALKAASRQCANSLSTCFNSNVIFSSYFPDELKLADVVPVHKKDDTTLKSNYRPISLLPSVSKLFERLIAQQIEPFLNTWLSKLLCGFRKGLNPQYAILNMLRDWQKCLNNSGKVGTILMDLSKAFDCLPHDLLIAKMAAYGFGKRTLRLFHSYLRNRKHRVRVGSSLSDYLYVILGVPQGSVLGPILFNIFINDLFLVIQESALCNFADDNTLSSCAQNLPEVIQHLKADLDRVLSWFSLNGMVVNHDKFQVMFPYVTENISIMIGNHPLESSKEVKLLGVIIDHKLSFYPHVQDLCKKALCKSKALMRIRGFLSQSQCDIIFNAFVMPAFNYCPLIWMFCSKASHTLIENTHCKILRIRFNSFDKDYNWLLVRGDTAKIHTKSLQLMVIEVFKTLRHLNPPIMWDSFALRNSPYTLRRGQTLAIPKQGFTVRAMNSFDHRAVLAWNHLSFDLKSELSLNLFKTKIQAVDIYCTCRLCAF